MPDTSYLSIKEEINSLKATYPWLRNKADERVFSLLSIKSNFFKNPALNKSVDDINEMIVDGTKDGGVDALFLDPNSDTDDLVLVQSKFYETITQEDVKNALIKMALFYNDMKAGRFQTVRDEVARKFLTLSAEVGDESKILFVFYTSAPKPKIKQDKITKDVLNLIEGPANIEFRFFFGSDLVEEIKDAKSRRACVEKGKIIIDEPDNYLFYGDASDDFCAAIVNASAFCIKKLYIENGLPLLAKNLRYHVPGKAIDEAIKDTIKNDPESFWFKNNGITIICDHFEISGKQVKLENFSIVNGGQTTFNLSKSECLDEEHDFYLPCKIIKTHGETEDERNKFSLEIAKATNSQKAIKQIDLKANAPEQVRFAKAMRAVEIFYQTKRGENIPNQYKDPDKNTDLYEIGKLFLAGVFELPATSRNKPSKLFDDMFYGPIFNSNQSQIASLSRELLYMDNYFKNTFLPKFDESCANNPNKDELIQFAHNARTTCIAFAGLIGRYRQGIITVADLKKMIRTYVSGTYEEDLYDIFKNVGDAKTFFPSKIFDNKEEYDDILYNLFSGIIKAGRTCYAHARRDSSNGENLNISNYLKKDVNYYSILDSEWDSLNDTTITVVYQKIEEYLK